MTIVLPCRLITRHRSHMGFTDGLTFILNNSLFSAAPQKGAHGITAPVRTRHGSKLGSSLRVRIFGPFSVTATVCSKCAESELSSVEIDHSSSWRYTPGP